ncbi:hypothetical protein KPL40_15725 [Clostridium gasigenes]|uniref:hypothetical protein n=1 Tax=Clostridium gasigenes TaxID=94869 RepID=UPI001C0BD903|nr:hypothetical protein [Clostridium gasigenes]MBU3133878.1 hypothetical protein [Clostridium gasigenes]
MSNCRDSSEWDTSYSNYQDRYDCCQPCCHKCIVGPTGVTGPSFNSYANGVITTNKISIAVKDTVIYKIYINVLT